MGIDEKKDGKQLSQKGTGKKIKYGIIVFIVLLLIGGFVVTMRAGFVRLAFSLRFAL